MQTGSEETGDLLDEGVRGDEDVVLLGQLLDLLLVLVQLLEVINRTELQTNLLGLIDVVGVSENANAHSRLGDVGQPKK